MSAASRLPTIAGTITLGALIAGLTRAYLARYLGGKTTRMVWAIAAVAFALTNLKNLPGVWHIRVLRGILYQLYLQPTPQPPKHLFAPLITSSRNSLYDCDYNLHKSNSTYFADLDVARAHTVGCLIRTGLARLNRGDEVGLPAETQTAKGSYYVALGAVSCFFQKQIEPLQSFEIYTRVLSWDRKWLYLVSHVVRKGAIKPEAYVLQPWKKSKRRPEDVKKEDEDLQKHIFATSLARYCFKKGRLTINPEIVLERSRLLPPRPTNVGLPPRAEASSNATPSATVQTPASTSELGGPETLATEVSSRLGDYAEHVDGQQSTEDSDWTWDDMEKERLRGLSTAVHFDKLSAVHSELRAGEVLGEYGDYCKISNPILNITSRLHELAMDDPARDRVFGCAELHEMILLKLPLRSILRTQAVSQSWRDAVTSSPALKQALFLAPAKAMKAWTLVDKTPESPTGPGGSGLLGPAAQPSELDRLVNIDQAEANGDEYLIQAKVNSVLPYRHLHFSQRLDNAHAVWNFCNYMHPDGPPAETAFSTNIRAIRRLHPTYKAMYLSQPPCKDVVVCVYGGTSQALVERITCEHPVGVTFQQIEDAVSKLQATQRIACLEVALWMRDVSFLRRKPEVVVTEVAMIDAE
ncbi:hypothetical protein LTR17_012394 [Elasticomyces elasticus]|nr:hypothetical protein LTR17_012394 [Elasticomyces elasticus]